MRNHHNSNNATKITAICADCNAEFTLNFTPKPNTKLYCKNCIPKHKKNKKPSRSYDIICSHCGNADTVPFRPFEGSIVLCNQCMTNPNVTRVGGKIMHAIICCSCGEETKVPFKPDPGSRVLCRHCHVEEKEQKELKKQRFAESHPAKIHGTKIKIDITCDKCGCSDSLPYVPKTSGPILCQQCAEHTFGEEWAYRHKIQSKEFHFNCAKCGKADFITFKPTNNPDKEWLCRKCLTNCSILHPDAENFQHDQFTFVRKKIKKSDN